MSEDTEISNNDRLGNLLKALSDGRLQDVAKHTGEEGAFADTKECDIYEEVFSMLANVHLSISNANQVVDLLTSGILCRLQVYLALASHQDAKLLNTILCDEFRVATRGNKQILEYLLDDERNLVLELFLLTTKYGEDWLSYIVKQVLNQHSPESCRGRIKTLLKCNPLKFTEELLVLHLLKKGIVDETLLRAVSHSKEKDNADSTLVELSSYLYHRLSLVKTLHVRPVSDLRATPFSSLSLLHHSCNLTTLDWEQTKSYLIESVKFGAVSSWEPSVFDAVFAVTWSLQLASAGCRAVEQHYEESVVSRLAQIKKIVNQIQPLTLRVEVLENILTLLLLRYEDLVDEEADRICESGTEEEEQSIRDESHSDRAAFKAPCHDYNSLSVTRKQGFICGPNLTRDLLLLLKESVTAASAAFYSSLNGEGEQWEAPSLLAQHELQTHIKQLSSYVHDALWRLEVVTSPDFIRSEGQHIVESSPYCDRPPDWTYIDSTEAESESDDESKMPLKGRNATDAERSSGSSSPAFTTGQSKKSSWKNRKRSQCLVPEKTATIERMLCTPTSLTNQCLLRGDIDKADHIVQVFNLAETISGAEVRFSREYHKLHRIHATPSFGIERSSSRNTTLQAVQRAASAGVQALQINYQVERLLSGVVPEVPRVDLMVGGSAKEHAVAVVAADVTLTLSKNAQQARSLIGLATQRCPELSKVHAVHFSAARSVESAAYCFIPFLRSLLQVTETSEEGSPLSLLGRWDLDYSPRFIRDHIQFEESLNSALSEWYSNRDDAALSKLLQAAAHVNYLKEKVLNSLFLEDTQPQAVSRDFLPARTFWNKFVCVPGSDSDKYAYLQDLESYLQALQKICTGLAPSEAGVEFTTLLASSPLSVLARPFEKGMSPSKLESAVTSLDLSLSLMLPGRMISLPPPIKLKPGSKAVILNDGVWPSAARKPSVVASSLLEGVLHELLVQWKELQLVNGKECRNLPVSLANSLRLQAVLADTKELAVIDLDLLQPGDETEAFFCNVTNLIMLHALLHTEINNGDLSALLSSNPCQRMCVQNTVLYRVGQLGLISLWKMLQLTLGGDMINAPSPPLEGALLKPMLTCDPRMFFAIATGRVTSPVVQVMRARRLNEQLDGAVREYCRFWTRIHENKVQIAPLIECYLNAASLPVSHLLKYCDTQPAKQDDLELKVFSECRSDAVFVLSYGTTNKWRNIKEQLHESRPLSNVMVPVSDDMSYLKEHIWPVALLVKLLSRTNRDEELIDSPAVVQRLLEMPDELKIASLLGVKVGMVAVHSCIPDYLLWSSLQSLNKNKKWKQVFDLLSALPTYQLKEDAALKVLRDLALIHLILEGPSSSNPSPWLLCCHLSCVDFQARCALTCAPSWPGEECCELLGQLVEDPTLDDFPHLKTETTKLHAKVRVCQEVLRKFPMSGWNTWKDVLDCAEKEPLQLLESIKDPALCFEWSQLFLLPRSIPKSDVDRIVRLLLQVDTCSLPLLEHVLSELPRALTARTLVNFLPNVSSVQLARFLLRFLDSTCRTALSSSDLEVVQLALIGLQMIQVLPSDEQDDFLGLLTHPHLLLEQMLMNMRLEAASCMLAQVREHLRDLSPGFPFSSSSVDHLLRTYAEKALDFRVVVAYSDHSDNLSCSISSYCSSKGKEFVMPLNAPSKSNWTPNEKAAVCMSCGVVAFSMFNRRHHCRRCGRVICGACSLNRLEVEGYGILKVRVCNDCFGQSTGALSLGQASLESVVEPHKLGSMPCSSENNIWRLTTSQTVNNTIREEFAYEHAPSVSLCLAILQLHSEHSACPSFLLDCCEKILDHLKPIAPSVPNPEVDYALVIQMCWSLVVAAKVKCAQWGYASGIVHCDQLGSQIDLFALLVDHGCSGLIMYEMKLPEGGSSLERCARDLRRLRNILLNDEFWQLALEVSTKGGLDRNGVWAAWGKGCLQAGCWEKARQKLAHCFVTSPGSSRPTKDSPLLLEILKILENLPKSSKSPKEHKTIKGNRQNADIVLLSLASLQDIAQGKVQQECQELESTIYTECCYYLRLYGSHALYLHFLLRHRDLEKALRHVLDNALEPHAFFQWLYIPCLKSGLITNLHAAMTTVDPSLNDWKVYLQGICGILEKRRLLHVLYEVQQWAGDHVRAAMTCIRFFRKGASSYGELVGRLKHLNHALAHLDASLAEVSAVEVQESTSSAKEMGNISGQVVPLRLPASELRRHQTTIWRQIEVTKFLAKCEASGRSVWSGSALPTLFNSRAEKEQLADLVILCGTDVGEGFGIATRIVGEFKLNAAEIYKRVGAGLMREQRVQDVLRLLKCIHSSGEDNRKRIGDELLLASVQAWNDLPPAQAEVLISYITDNAVKIKAYIACHLLKSAYLMAIKCDRLQDVEVVLEEAERLGQSAIRNICLKRLGRT